ncbi:MAG TPA: hypothetical protein VM840_09555 [Actinomycetota bacterium]|nr:hypothetical protein [Actinomycetota bacterium]
MEHLTIERRFRGPPDSANGGYACGSTALPLDGRAATVTLRRPPPLGRPLAVSFDGGRVQVRDGDELIAEAQPAELDLPCPPPPSYEDAVAAAESFDTETYTTGHVFPECFTCGPARDPGDGLRLFPGWVPGGGSVVWPWVPSASVCGPTGEVPSQVVWAALDCPSGMAWLHSNEVGPAVLGRMTADVVRLPRQAERLVVGGWRVGAEGRKLVAGSAIWTADGEVLARNLATWIRLTDEQRVSFRTTGR